MRTFSLVLGFILSATAVGFAQNPPPPVGVDSAIWKQLMDEVDKGGDPDDPGKMIRYWKKAVTGSLTALDKSELTTLANRRAKRGLGPDGKVYMTMFAAVILEHNSSKVETDKQIRDLKKALDDLRMLIEKNQPTLTAR